MSYDVMDLREREFPWAARGDAIYLNNASTGPLPVRTVGAQASFTALRAEPFRMSDELQFGTISHSRNLVARLIGASPDEIALMVNTTYGINVAARALPLGRGDTVLTFDREFPANIYPWMALAPIGVTLERIPCRDGLADEEALLLALDKPGVKAVTVSWVSFATGYRVDLARIGRACRERGIYFIVDAMQGLGALTLDVRECFVDVLACGGQKWLLSPWGTGFVYVRSELVTALEPSSVGWLAMRGSEDFTRLVDYDFTYWDDARRFEVITLPFQDFAGLNASLELLLELGPKRVEAHVAGLVDMAVEWSRNRAAVKLVTPAEPERRAGIVALAPSDPRVASEKLKRARISHSLREGAIRLSPHCYNTDAEMEEALEVLGRE
ncbi:MAG: aminotransferase class V-fold PLP-dependent enzyme [Gemmatimonadaceae bacterium]|nr:aminotransferase class V-fold PLP-dependent enzyme [Gemmatimonadaceae bacterium]MDQ3519947.1 aminotransferase class V-fold PLP-dependent enzyme [Gemmatimonadota bacterium]